MKTLNRFIRVTLIAILLLSSFPVLYAQVAINTDGSNADGSAMLDVKSTTKGLLVPRMTNTEMNGVTSPATGLMVYNTTDSAFYFYNGIAWKNVSQAMSDNDWVVSGTNMYSGLTGNVGIGINNPNGRLYIRDNISGLSYPLKIENKHGAVSDDAIGLLFSTGGSGNNDRGKGGLVYEVTSTWNRGSFHFLQDDNTGTGNPDLNDAVVTIQNNGFVGVGITTPLTNFHLRDVGISLPIGAIKHEQLTIEDYDAGLGLYSSRAGNYGSLISFGEVISSVLNNKWSIFRTTSINSGHENQLRFSFGTSANYASNPVVLTFDEGGGVGVGTTAPDASAKLDVSSTTNGFLPPRMTREQITYINNPASGLLVFNVDDNHYYFYDGGAKSWKEVALGTVTIAPFVCGSSFTDSRDMQSYTTVQIGTQCWMAENLNIGTMINGNLNQTNNGTIEKYCYSNNTGNCKTYGGLYQWDEMMQYVTTEGVQGICPTGWHLPTDDEWKTMEMYLGMTQAQADGTGYRGTDEGGKLKETGTTHWISPNTGATNSSGFTALPGGNRYSYGSFLYLGDFGYWWSSSEYSGTDAWFRGLGYNYSQVDRNNSSKAYGFSVRCLKD